MRARLSPRQIQELLVLEQIEPFGERAQYLRTGILCSVLANIHRDPKQKSSPYKPEDFIPKFGGEIVSNIRERTPDEMFASIDRMFQRQERRKAKNAATI